MDFTQSKLTKAEWCSLEVPVAESEKRILKMIYSSWDNPNIQFNDAETIMTIMRINSEEGKFHFHFYKEYFKTIIDKLIKKYEIKYDNKKKDKKIQIKKKDLIRIKNFNKKIDSKKEDIYEFILLKYLKKYLSAKKSKEKKNIYYYYILNQLLKNTISHLNIHVEEFVKFILDMDKTNIKIKDIIIKSHDYIEQNKILLKYRDIHLYSHQKDVITNFQDKKNKLLLYQAPTGTGKTMTPIALSRGKKVIFVCAAKHIGLQLAKSCISLEIPIAIAFGCKDPGDIRLHYFAAKDYTKNWRTGSIFRVDNSVGDKVEIIICDVQSYLPAMNYMLAFNDEDDIVWYWDEPTITLDYETHEFHEILKKNWRENMIANIVLSSATLPNMDEITDMLQSYKYKFRNSEIKEVLSYECRKSIPLISPDGYKILPHYIFENYDEIKKSLKHIDRNKTILRHFDVGEISKFIMYINKNKLVKDRFLINEYFEDISDVNIINIKMYYLLLLKKCKKEYSDIYRYFLENRKKSYNSTIKITTSDAHTLTDGPTIFLTNNVKKIAGVYLKASQISQSELDNIMTIINKNEKWKNELEKVEEEERQRKDKQSDEVQERSHNKDSKEYQIIEKYNKLVESIKKKIKAVELQKIYIPNTKNHLRKWTDRSEVSNEFSSDIDDKIVEQIMILNIEKAWKILLLMGIGVFTKNNTVSYMEIMKKLAEQQKLYLIIASSDYIYGTNYQFCHGYLSKDLQNMTQEKMIQAFGRVGRQNSQMDYTLRIRDENLIRKLFLPEEFKMEVVNMNRLFCVE
tara:strand:+ start:3836 stop:6226 length:2391 start_codon:yes stop_codon:yes gene_type:complete